jgi:hypothetical protein
MIKRRSQISFEILDQTHNENQFHYAWFEHGTLDWKRDMWHRYYHTITNWSHRVLAIVIERYLYLNSVILHATVYCCLQLHIIKLWSWKTKYTPIFLRSSAQSTSLNPQKDWSVCLVNQKPNDFICLRSLRLICELASMMNIVNNI